MLLSEFKQTLNHITEVIFLKPDGSTVPSHFHITEVGEINKKFIDCGGTIRNENVISMQLWASEDIWHQLQPQKLISIIDIAQQQLHINDNEIEIEYQSDTIGKYGVIFNNGNFILTPKQTTCLASDKCGIPSFEKKQTIAQQSCCSPNSGCC